MANNRKNKNMKKALLLIVAVCSLVLTSCSFSSNLTLNHNNNNTSVILQENNYMVVKDVTGTATANYIFGIGGTMELYNNAYADMVRQANLRDGQALINIRVEEGNAVKFFITQKRVTYSATVIQFK